MHNPPFTLQYITQQEECQVKPSSESWVKLPLKLLRQQGMSKSSAAVCCIIIDQCAKSDRSLQTWVPISTSEMAESAGCTKRTAIRAVLELEALHLIEVKRESGCASRYRLTGCVELCPAAFTAKQPPKQSQRITEREREEMDDYLSLVNRFKEDTT